MATASRCTTAASRATICRRADQRVQFVLRQVFGQQAQHIGFERRAGFADGGHARRRRRARTGSTAFITPEATTRWRRSAITKESTR